MSGGHLVAHPDSHIIVAGEMGVGKTTVGGLLALELGMPFVDSDTVLEERTGEDAAAFAERLGVVALHRLELQIFLEMCRSGHWSVIAPAASVIDHAAGREAMARGLTVWLTADDSVLAARQSEGEHRRAVDDQERRALTGRRAPMWREVADIRLDTGSRTPDELVGELIDRLGAFRSDRPDTGHAHREAGDLS